MQMSLEFREVIPGKVAYATGFITPERSERLRREIDATSTFSQERLSIRGGIEVPFPRLVAWHGDEGVGYNYSGIIHPPAVWTEPLAAVRADVCNMLGYDFNGVLLNLYRDGADSIGRHGDREDDLIEGSPIVGISLGVTRQIRFRENKGHQRSEVNRRPYHETIDLDLEDGSMLLMFGDCQRTWTHEIKKDHTVKGERLSLTFRCVRRA